MTATAVKFVHNTQLILLGLHSKVQWAVYLHLWVLSIDG